MKHRLIAIILTICILLTFGACGKKKDDAPDPSASEAQTEAETSAPALINGTKEVNYTAWVTADALNVRAQNNTTCAVKGKLQNGTQITIIGEDYRNGVPSGWLVINYQGANAYISADYVTQTKPATANP